MEELDRVTELSVLYEISAIPTRLMNLDQVGALAVDKATRLLVSDVSIFYSYRPETDTFHPQAARGVSLAHLDDWTLSNMGEVVASAVAGRRPVAWHSGEPTEMPRLVSYQVQTALCVPVRSGDELLGLIYAARLNDRPFTASEQSLFGVLANRIAGSVENLHLLEAGQRRGLRLQIAAEVARAASSILDLDSLLSEVVELIRERFDLYYVGIFLVDEVAKYAVLRSGTGEMGRQMLEANHRLEIGGTSMIGWSVANRKARIALDVGKEAIRFNNPMTPETRSEMALPLISRDEAIGAMTIQSVQEAAFADEDIVALQTMADQLANAIENARLFAKTQERLQAVETAQYQYRREAWSEYIKRRPTVLGYEYDLNDLRPLPEVQAIKPATVLQDGRLIAQDDENGGSGAVLLAPINLSGEPIGVLGFEEPEQPRRWNPDEVALVEAVSDQLAAVLENRRLFEQTQDALRQTDALFRASRRIVTANDLPDLYQTVVDEIGRWVGVDQCQLVVFEPHKRNGEIKAAYRATPDTQALQIPTESHPLMDLLRDRRQQGIEIQDVDADPALAPMRKILNSLGIKSSLLIPMTVRGELIGLVWLYTVEQMRKFTDAEIDFCRAVTGQAAIAIDNLWAFREQQETAERLREVDKLKTQFLANMSHELRTPLNSIIGFARVILKGIDGPLTELQQTDLGAIYNSGQHLLGLINDILDVAKIEAGKMDLNFEEVDLKQIIKGVMSTAVGLVKDKPVQLEHRVPDDLPPIWADSTRVRQIVLNLVSNAAKFTEQGKISVSASYNDDWVTVKVADTGIGIPEDKLDTIFEEFTQVDASTTRRAGGTGLGLPITRHFVQLHGGEINVESKAGVGSVFAFTLPIHPREDKEKEVAGGETSEAQVPDGSRRLVLAVDDDAHVLNLYKRYLEDEGYQVIGITSSDDVVQKAKEVSPYAITLDVLMPGKDGWQVLQELKNCPETHDIPIVICSILSEEGRGFSLGAADYLVKPIMEDELLNALTRLDHPRGKRVEVLVIDDHVDDILLIRRILEAQGDYRISEANGGRAGIEMVHRRPPDVIILDLMMPDVDGFGVLEALKREPETRVIPVIVVTAKQLTEEDRKRLNGQVEVLLNKGLFTERELLEDVKVALAKVQSHLPKQGH
jgi:signal transduction histidine kinase/DNA-binding response OmpR family regulator/putative methionine-R-sulfoxide reductase with GAF domain